MTSWWTLLSPWQPSPTVVSATVLAAILYLRGRLQTDATVGRQIIFWLGLVSMYAALQTQVDYYAEREFFVHRLQHLVLHHLGPFLVALAWPWPVMRAGLPERLRSWAKFVWRRATALRGIVHHATSPVVEPAAFVALIWVWLIPEVHFYAMLDVRWYRLMNWSVALDGVVFWSLALDPRSAPAARLGPAARVLMQAACIPPQVAAGAFVTFAGRNLYPFYDWCGRAFAAITARQDQTLGGLILWIPATMMSLAGVLIAMYRWFQSTERLAGSSGKPLPD